MLLNEIGCAKMPMKTTWTSGNCVICALSNVLNAVCDGKTTIVDVETQLSPYKHRQLKAPFTALSPLLKQTR